MKMNKINKISDIQANDLILFVSLSGSLKAVDKIISIQENGQYEYYNMEGKKYQGNIRTFMESFFVFKVDENIYKYLNKNLSDAFLSVENLFFNLYNSEAVSSLVRKQLEKANKDFDLRVKFIDFVNNNKDEIFDVSWMHDVEMRKCDERLQDCINKINKEFEEVLKVA